MFLNLILLGGLLAAGIPLMVHIAHQRKALPVPWGAMRFLLQMVRQNRRRLFLEQWLLLTIRTLLLLCLALALLRPAIPPAVAQGEGLIRSGGVAAVLLFDDSASTGAGRETTALARMKDLAAAYLDTLQKGDEVSILRLSELGSERPSPLLDLDAARQLAAGITATGVTSDVPALLEAGLAQLTRHRNPTVEMVLLTDGGAEGWRESERARWAELQQRFRPDAAATLRQPHLLVLQPARAGEGQAGNLSVENLAPDSGVVPVGKTVRFVVTLRQTGTVAQEHLRLRLRSDGRTVSDQPLQLAGAAVTEVSVPCLFHEPGAHLVEAEIVGARDGFAADDRRSYALEAQAHIPVLLVEESLPPDALAGSLGFVACALNPEDRTQELFALTRIAAADLRETELGAFRVVVLGNLCVLDRASILALERYLACGGGLLATGGDRLVCDTVNRFWARGGDGFLPCPLDRAVRPAQEVAAGALLGKHPALLPFSGDSAESVKEIRVRRYFALDQTAVAAGELRTLLTLADGAPLAVERQRGQGKAVFFAAGLDRADSNLPLLPLFVPLVRGLVSYLASDILPPRNLRPGQALYCRTLNGVPQAQGPDGQPLALMPGAWEGVQAYCSAPLRELGGYSVTDGGRTIYYAVQLDPQEVGLRALEPAIREQLLRGFAPVLFQEPQGLQQALDSGSRQAVELWRYLVLAALALLFAESLVSRRQSACEVRLSGSQSGRQDGGAQS